MSSDTSSAPGAPKTGSTDGASGGATAQSGGGMEIIQKAVQFTADQVAPKTGEVLGALEDPAGAQAAALMMGDLRGYMQGTEQILMAASGQAMKLLLDEATQPTGITALEKIVYFQGELTTFAGKVVTEATKIKTEFSS